MSEEMRCPKCDKVLWPFGGFLACVGPRGHGLYRLILQPANPKLEKVV
jgi:hypothetical protein